LAKLFRGDIKKRRWRKMNSNLCQYKSKCSLPYEEHRCLNNFNKCIVYQRYQKLEEVVGIGAIDEDTMIRIKTISAEEQRNRFRRKE
jgi:hypothetical protein